MDRTIYTHNLRRFASLSHNYAYFGRLKTQISEGKTVVLPFPQHTTPRSEYECVPFDIVLFFGHSRQQTRKRRSNPHSPCRGNLSRRQTNARKSRGLRLLVVLISSFCSTFVCVCVFVCVFLPGDSRVVLLVEIHIQ